MPHKTAKGFASSKGFSCEDFARLSELEENIGYPANGGEGRGLESNERLEFIGDAILQFVASEYLYRENAHATEGALTMMRSSIVARKHCAAMAKKLGLGKYVLVGKGEKETAGGLKNSILANTFEALVASLYLDGGIKQARRFVLRMLKECMPTETTADHNFKAQLQDTCQKSGRPIPSYRLISSEGPEHQKTFEVEVSIGGLPYGRGKGTSKKEAQQQAAREAVERVRNMWAE